MTPDPILAALLSDPDPDARLIAADYAASQGEELLELMLRLRARGKYYANVTYPSEFTGTAWSVTFYTDSMVQGDIALDAFHEDDDQPKWAWTPRGGWRSRPRGWKNQAELEARSTGGPPPPGLEAAVLAVLRARLAEVRQE